MGVSVRRSPNDHASDIVAPSIVANHVSPLDAFFIAILTNAQITGVARDWTLSVPFFSAICRAHHVLAVKGKGAVKSDGTSRKVRRCGACCWRAHGGQIAPHDGAEPTKAKSST